MIKTFNFSERGGHATNEDAQHICVHPSDSRCHVCALADGQGGRAGGQAAARIAVQAAVDAMCAQRPAQLAHTKAWRTLLHEADVAVSRDADAGFTTLVAFALFDNIVVGASSGDSAAVAFMGGGHQILTENQKKNPPVGSEAAAFVPFACPLRAPWKVLAMSDGVWNYVGWQCITELASEHNGRDLIDALCNKARLPRSGEFQDDFTVVLAEGSP